MTNMKKLLMFAAAGLLAVPATNAQAEVGTAEVSTMIVAPLNDKAPVSGNPARLRRTDEEQPGNEMAKFAMFADNKKGLYVSMATELNGQAARHRMQLAVVPFSLVQNTAGKVTAAPDMTKARFATDNIGNEYRNANHPSAVPIMGGKLIAVKYNYQPNNTNNTETYLQIFNDQGATVMPQKRIMQKNNDDCSMAADSNDVVVFERSATSALFVHAAGCNGNGRDDGWLNAINVTCQADMSSCNATKAFDLSVVPREERSHAAVVRGTDENTVYMAYTEGNTQPQRDGVWLAAINVGQGQNGEGAQSRLLWKKQLAGRKTVEGLTTYAMRAKLMPIEKWDAATGKLVPTDQLVVHYGDLRGNNNTNGKGGTYYTSMLGVIDAKPTGMTYVHQPKDVSADLPGSEGTHMIMQATWFGTTNAMTPGLFMTTGSHTGGGNAGKARAVSYDATTGKFADAGMYAIAPYDRHLYPNYLGNNPGNQGRNYASSTFIANPYVGMNGNTDSHLMIFSSTGKDPSQMMDPARKLTAYLTVLPVVTTPKVTPPPAGSGSGSNPPPTGGTPDPTNPDEPAGTDEAGTALGGCSATTGSGGALSLLLIGLAAFIRRRR
jgi:MYXO-CTERM domain-containing protein